MNSSEKPSAAEAKNADSLRSQVREDYARVAQGNGAGGCCGPAPHAIDLVLAYSEKHRSLELRLDSAGPPGNPLETADLPDDLALAIIHNYAEDIAYERGDERNRLRMRVK